MSCLVESAGASAQTILEVQGWNAAAGFERVYERARVSEVEEVVMVDRWL